MPAFLTNLDWTAKGVWVLAGIILYAVINQVVPWRKQSLDADKAFRDGLLARIQAQDDRITTLEAELAAERASRSAEASILRHENNNLSRIITMFIALIEASPEKAQAHAAMIRQEIEKAQDRISAEKAAIRGAEIIAARAKSAEGE